MDFELLGVRLRFISDQKKLIEYIKHFTCLSFQEARVADPDIQVKVNYNTEFKLWENSRRISRNIWLGENKIYISKLERLPGLALSVKIENSKLFVDAFFINKKKNIFKKVISGLMPDKVSQEFQLIAFVFYLIYYPLFYYLERFGNYFLMHASAIEYRGRGVILAGLGGVGKSTFSLGALSSTADNRFISDNLIFCDTRKIYSFPELIALDPESIRLLKNMNQLLIPRKSILFSHNRTYYQIRPEAVACEAIPEYLFWLQRGSHNRIVPVEKDICRKNLLDMNFLAKELREYFYFAAALDLAFSQKLLPIIYDDSLSSLLSSLDCFMLEYQSGYDIKTVFKETLARVIP